MIISFEQDGITCPNGRGACDEKDFVPLESASRIASPDDSTWQKYAGNPVFLSGDSGAWDDGGVTCFVVKHFPWAYMMYYSAGGNYGRGFGLATSEDGIHWTRHEANPVMVPDSGVVVWGPEVLHDGERYHMWYVSRGPDMDGISHATSDDGVQWIQSENNPVIDHGGCHAVIWDGQQYRMFIQHSSGRRHGFQLATSADGDSWEVQDWAFYSGSLGEWDEITAAPSVAYYEGQLHLWYTGADTVGNRRGEIAIGHAASNDWGESFIIPEVRTDLRTLRPTERWEGRGLYSSGVDYDGENIFVWYAATGPNGGFGFASRPVNAVKPPPADPASQAVFWTVNPNPSAGSIRINHLGSLSAPALVKLLDTSGRLVYMKRFGASEPLLLNPGSIGLPVGKYFLEVEVRGKTVHKQFTLLK
jgi:predicted GH43/DUF377 family glycosyl hydrolase